MNNKSEKSTSLSKEILSWILAMVCAFLIAEFISKYIIVNANIPSESMENTIMTEDRLIANRLAYKSNDPQRKDIIVFRYPVDDETLYIKRIIGLPGEKVEIIGGQIYIDGDSIPLDEDYLPEKWTRANDGYSFEVPQDCYFVLGDNRNYSEDARFWKELALEHGMTEEDADACQFVRRDQIEGKAMFRYWPITDFKTF